MSAPAVTIIELADRADWNRAVVRGPALPTHRHAVIAAAAQPLGGTAKLWCWHSPRGAATCAVITRPVPGGGFDLVTPIGFSGLAHTGDPSGLAAAWTASWRAEGAVAAYLQLHPFQSSEAWKVIWADIAPGLSTGPITYVWDLAPELDTLEGDLARDHKLRLRKWWKTNTETVTDHEHLAERFAELYTAFAQRKDVGSAYRMHHAVLHSVAADKGVLAVGARTPNAPISAVSLFPHAGDRADYYLNGASPEGRHHARGLVWTAMTMLRARG
ncbi:MAG TPA: hypothetical protein DFR83_23065, partial [Deltaproteobacteria bacterium]|nr:hypothetical protein [Deltaproteobacteria bacterium]